MQAPLSRVIGSRGSVAVVRGPDWAREDQSVRYQGYLVNPMRTSYRTLQTGRVIILQHMK